MKQIIFFGSWESDLKCSLGLIKPCSKDISQIVNMSEVPFRQ